MSHCLKRSLDAVHPPEHSTTLSQSKRQKCKCHQRDEGVPNFWDNLSKLWLTRRALREFDRRTVRPTTPTRPYSIGAEQNTSTQLKYFAENGGPSLGDLRSYPTSKERTVLSSHFTMTTGAYDLDFEEHLKDHGVYLPDEPSVDEASKPLNRSEILSSLGQSRSSEWAITEDDWKDFRNDNKSCSTESKVKSEVIRTIAGKPKLDWEMEVEFNNIKPLTNHTKRAKPDYYDGSKPSELALSIRKELHAYLVPSTNDSRPLLPNFSLEVKGPNGNLACLIRQALHIGGLGARAIHELRSWTAVKKLDDQKAYTIAATYQPTDGVLTLFSIHPVPSKNSNHRALSSAPARRWKYHMTLLNRYFMTTDLDGFKKGVYAYRNAREWCKKQRDDLVKKANKKANKVVPDDNLGPLDELAYDI
ncbi:MAG: hypothetical protein Q9182_000157 [Xanthomendoza sp. 2 TL-2023]